MKAVLMSIQPKWCARIVSGDKTVEVRKTKPKLETPFKCYIYCTYGEGLIEANDEILPNHLIEHKVSKHKIWGNCCNGKVIGEFVCDRIIYSFLNNNDGWFVELGCLTPKEIDEYQGDKAILYGWHITDLVIYDKPRELGEFKPYNRTEDDCKFSHLGFAIPRCQECKECYVKRPPQSWCYVEEVKRDGT